ncbi:MAG: GntR family transcriptional regulator [Kiritimatiellia bacterium]|jgi:DNA-binding LacI/PurR family transcriptional regulator
MKNRKTIPAHLSIRTTLKKEILDGKHAELSESRVIQRFKVSSATARRVLNDLALEGLVSRQVGRGSIVRQPHDRAFREYGAVFFDIFDLRDFFIAEIVRGIEERASSKEHQLHLFTTRGKQLDDTGASSISYLVKSRKIHGLFVLSPLDAGAIQFFMEERLPCVAVGNNYPGLQVPTVMADNRRAMLDVCHRLMREGLQRIAVVVRHNPQRDVERGCDFIARAYHEYYAECKLHPEPAWWQAVEDEREAAVSAMNAMSALPAAQRPQAVVVHGKNLSTGVNDFLTRSRDWQPVLVHFTDRQERALRTITAPYRKVGRMAFDLMEDMFANPTRRTANAPVLLPMDIHWPLKTAFEIQETR